MFAETSVASSKLHSSLLHYSWRYQLCAIQFPLAFDGDHSVLQLVAKNEFPVHATGPGHASSVGRVLPYIPVR